MTAEWPLAQVQDVVAEAVPTREMLVWEGVRRTYGEVARRTRGLAGFLASRQVGLVRERAGLERWQCGQVPVAIVMGNRPEYVEAMLGCFRARAVPFNVNHHYTPVEVRSLLAGVGCGAVVYQRSVGPLVEGALDGQPVLLVDVDDGSGVAPLPGSTGFEQAVVAGAEVTLPAPSGDDLYLVCTGGTTGAPKGVLWRQADVFVAAMAGAEDATAVSLATAVAAEPEIWFAGPPLMHAAAQWTVFSGLHRGATVVLHDDSRRFDAAALLDTADRERVTLLSIVGDAYARPLVEELRRRPRRLTGLRRIATGGAMTSTSCKEAFLDLLPRVTVVDGYGSSETGGMAFAPMSRSHRAGGLAPAAGAVVLSADRRRLLDPGDDEIGWIARRGRVPLGYVNDPAATTATFPMVDGVRFAVPGDRGQLQADGSIRMLGRDSMVVNTGGEKVFVEEVEQALLRHPAVADALVVGRPSRRFGEEVVAVVQLRPGATAEPAELRQFCTTSVARFKAPRAVVFTDAVVRHPTGKPDYRWARALARRAVPTTPAGS